MNFSEFKKLLGADPHSTDPEFLAARRSGPEFEQAALEAEAFEARLRGALEVPVDEDALLESLLALPAQPAVRAHAWSRPRWLAMAAGLLLAVGLATFLWQQPRQPQNLEDYLMAHYRLDGGAVLARAAGGFDRAEVNRILARLDAVAATELVGQVDFIKLCPTLHGDGAHMVVSSSRGQVTVIYMPNTVVADTVLVQFDDVQARVIALESGSAAIIGSGNGPFTDVEDLVRGSISTLGLDA